MTTLEATDLAFIIGGASAPTCDAETTQRIKNRMFAAGNLTSMGAAAVGTIGGAFLGERFDGVPVLGGLLGFGTGTLAGGYGASYVARKVSEHQYGCKIPQ